MSEKQLRKGCLKFILFYFVVAIVFYFVAGEQIKYKEQTYQNYVFENVEITGELFDGITIEQEINTELETINSISLLLATYGRVNNGNMNIQLIDMSNKEILADKNVDISTLVDNSVNTIYFDEKVEVKQQHSYSIKIKVDAVGKENAITLYNTLDIQNYDEMTFIPNNQKSVLCISVSGDSELLFGKYYFQIITLIGLAIVIYSINLLYKSKNKKYSIGLSLMGTINKYRFLVEQLVSRDFKTKYKRSVLGVLWSFLNPLLTMMVQYIVFSTLFKSDIPNYPVYLLTGIVFFNYFSEATGMALGSIVNNASLITKVYVPKCIYPISRILSSSINLLLSLIPLLVVVLLTGTKITFAYILMVFPIACLLIFSLGIGLILASMMVFFRDTQFLWGVASLMWMYATPVFYPETIIPDIYMFIYKLNPMYHIIRFARAILINGASPEPRAYLICLLASLITLLVGTIVFKKTQDKFALHI